MTVSKVLREQAGIQYDKVTDKSEADPRDSLVNALFTGEFKRGRFDTPFKVTLENIRAVLGYEPENMIYVAIEDALKAGAPFIWVMRIEGNLMCTSVPHHWNGWYFEFNDESVFDGWDDPDFKKFASSISVKVNGKELSSDSFDLHLGESSDLFLELNGESYDFQDNDLITVCGNKRFDLREVQAS